ncbi:unnamed protein product [Rotaria sp. Silwood2]|nr:unnamed protein product [Rotaria sp. Silwood2]CAF2789316.1 unnamed protein product [Rotaria sp. Silwood2]CAF3055458.1 unnamed protein product [Rotaria sp. Silwood2]CAF3371853.1 unnamed protein product [Rotaria sp. Silwood2]CAF3973512.1 unnamed protein product [Rotaria sp. Silwood2]
MGGTYNRDRFSFDTIDNAILYLSMSIVDSIQYKRHDGPSKLSLFYAVEHNEEILVKILLKMEMASEKNMQ